MIMYVFDNSNLSKEIFAIDTWGAVICSLGHGRKHMLTILPTVWRPGLMETRPKRPGPRDVSDSVSSSFDTREHFDYNIASLTGIVINCSVSSSCNDRSNH